MQSIESHHSRIREIQVAIFLATIFMWLQEFIVGSYHTIIAPSVFALAVAVALQSKLRWVVVVCLCTSVLAIARNLFFFIGALLPVRGEIFSNLTAVAILCFNLITVNLSVMVLWPKFEDFRYRKQMSRVAFVSVLFFALFLYQSNGSKPSPLRLVCHSGLKAKFPEGTLPAIQDALRFSELIKTKGYFPLVEVDVQGTKDGTPIIFHDSTLDRTTNGHGPVNSWSLQQIKQLDAGSWFSQEFKGTPIPTLAEGLSLIGGRSGVFLDIKVNPVTGKLDRDLLQNIVQIVRESGMAQSAFVVSCSDHEALFTMKERLPQIATFVEIDPHLVKEKFSAYSLPQFIKYMKRLKIDGIDLPQFATLSGFVA